MFLQNSRMLALAYPSIWVFSLRCTAYVEPFAAKDSELGVNQVYYFVMHQNVYDTKSTLLWDWIFKQLKHSWPRVH